jgi:hypothetical protein
MDVCRKVWIRYKDGRSMISNKNICRWDWGEINKGEYKRNNEGGFKSGNYVSLWDGWNGELNDNENKVNSN